EKIGLARQERRRPHDGVLFLAKEIEKGLANLRRGHGAEIKRTFRRMRELLPMEQERQAPAIERPINVRRRRPRQTLAHKPAWFDYNRKRSRALSRSRSIPPGHSRQFNCADPSSSS